MKPRTLPSFYTHPQMVRLCQAPDRSSRIGLRDRALLSLLCSTGLRATELCKLQVLDLYPDRLLVRRGKFGHQRWVPVSPATRRAIDRYFTAHPPQRLASPVIRTQSGGVLSRRHLHKIVVGHARRVGLRGCVHTLRHSAATHWLNSGVSLFSVKALLGHARLSTTAVYCGTAVDGLVAELGRCVWPVARAAAA